MRVSLAPTVAVLLLMASTCAGQASEQATTPTTALLIVDVQMFYFGDGKSSLVEPEKAARNARRLLDHFREQGLTVVHVRHNSQAGGEIHPLVQPVAGEKVISKNSVSCFKEGDLLQYLHRQGVERLVICGMMTHMCVEAATRAASDLGFSTIVVADACATRDLEYQGRVIAARDVHDATLATLARAYAEVVDTETLLNRLDAPISEDAGGQ